jgi:ribosome-binding protein aMBF1 (putative translation factor)
MSEMIGSNERDDLDDFITEASADPVFEAALDQARQRRMILRELAERRKAAGLSRSVVAGRMGTSEAAVARLESGVTDPRWSSVERFAAAIGVRLDIHLVAV